MVKTCGSGEKWYRHIDDAAYSCARHILENHLEVKDDVLKTFLEPHHSISISSFKKKVQDEVEGIRFIQQEQAKWKDLPEPSVLEENFDDEWEYQTTIGHQF